MVDHSGKSGMYSYTDALCTGLGKIGEDVTVLTSTAWPDREKSYKVNKLFFEFNEKQGKFTRLHWASDRLFRSIINIIRRNKFAIKSNLYIVHIQGAGLPLMYKHFLKPLA